MQTTSEQDNPKLALVQRLSDTADFHGWLSSTLRLMQSCSLAVLGDFCIDAYWDLDETADEYSLETGLRVRHVTRQRYSLGGAGNVVANLTDLDVGRVQAIGIAGTDPFGKTMQEMLSRYRNCSCDVVQDPAWETMVYAKPCIGRQEESRLDFGTFNQPDSTRTARLLELMERAACEHDIVILNQQVENGVLAPEVIESVNSIIARSPKAVFLVDARHHLEQYSGALLKVNMSEAARLLGEAPVFLHENERAIEFAFRIYERTSKPAFVTRGERGIAVAEDGNVALVAGLHVDGPIDTVGAGDTVVATIAAALATGATPWQAATLANLAATITVKKLQTTGTASPQEIVAAASGRAFELTPSNVSVRRAK